MIIKRGPCKVTIYAPTPDLPFYRICYRVGGKRLQRIRKVFKEAEQEANAIPFLGKICLWKWIPHQT